MLTFDSGKVLIGSKYLFAHIKFPMKGVRD
jgi:hypothetical protein